MFDKEHEDSGKDPKRGQFHWNPFPHKQPSDSVSFEEMVAWMRILQTVIPALLLESVDAETANRSLSKLEEKIAAQFAADNTPEGRLFMAAWERAQRP